MVEMKKKYLNKIDYFRGLAIIGIVAIHTIGQMGSESGLLYYLNLNIKQAMTYSVPLFVFISGLVLTYVHYDEKINYFRFTKKRIISVLIPYIFWSCIYLGYRIFIENEAISPLIALKKLLVGSADFHLWYIILIFQFYTTFPLLLEFILKFKKRHLEMLAAVFAFNLLIISIYYSHFDYLSERLLRKIFIFWIFYFMLGAVMGLNVDHYKQIISSLSLKKIVTLYIIGLAFLIFSYYSDGMITNQSNIFWFRPEILIYATLSIIVAIKFMIELNHKEVFRPPLRLLKTIGKYSFGIYLAHILIRDILILIFEKIETVQNIPLPDYLLLVLDLLLSLIFVMAVSRLSFERFIVGTPR